MRNQLRSLKLTKYFTDPIIGAVPEDVVEIDLLYKETNNPTVYTVKSIKPIDGEDMWPDFNNPNNVLKRGEYEMKAMIAKVSGRHYENKTIASACRRMKFELKRSSNGMHIIINDAGLMDALIEKYLLLKAA